MAKRTIQTDPDQARKKAYSAIDGDALSALWEVISILSASGTDIGPKATEMLVARQLIKSNAPKG